MSSRVIQYEVSVRGAVPSDLEQKISAAHAKALQTPTDEVSHSVTTTIDSKDEQPPDASIPISGEARSERQSSRKR